MSTMTMAGAAQPGQAGIGDLVAGNCQLGQLGQLLELLQPGVGDLVARQGQEDDVLGLVVDLDDATKLPEIGRRLFLGRPVGRKLTGARKPTVS